MSLLRIRGKVVFTCDGCDDALETDTDGFAEARDELKAERWQTSKDDDTGEWMHHCPGCKSASFKRWMD